MLTILKLNNGNEVIGTVEGCDEYCVILRDPMHINYRLTAVQPTPMVSVTRYMPFSEDNTIFKFDRSVILHEAKPRKSMEEYYEYALNTHYENIDGIIDTELLNAVKGRKSNDIDQAYRELLEHVHFDGVLN